MTAHSAVISLKQDLELLLNSPDLFGYALEKGKYQELNNKLGSVIRLLRHSLGESYLQSWIGELVLSAMQSVELLLHEEESENSHSNDSLGDEGTQVTVSWMNTTMKGLLFEGLYNDISLMDLLLTDCLGESCFQNGIIDVVTSMKKDLENPHKAEVQKIYDNLSLIDLLMRDSSQESYGRELSVEFQNQIRDVAKKAADYLCCEDHLEVFADDLEVFVDFGAAGPATNVRRLPATIVRRRLNVCTSFKHTTLHELAEEIASIKDELMKKIDEIREVNGIAVTQNFGSVSSSTDNFSTLWDPLQNYRNKDGKLIGLKKDLEEMLYCLIGPSSNFKVFSVIGMAGIGKTTFVKELYDHPLVKHHFDVHAWATVSQEYNLKELLLSLLGCITNLSDVIFEMNHEQLKEQLYRSLRGRRYLIVLDDVWNTEVWNDLSRVFPNDNNGSRALLTSRLQGVAIHASPDPHHCLRYLTQGESWELLCSKVFPNGLCPIELLDIGKEIAYKCHGLPLAIVVVGGLLSKLNKTLEVWGEVAQNVGPLIMDDPQHYQNILALSYNHLPAPLKPCFLYMGIFPEDYEISSRKLTCLWVAEGFVQPKEQKLLEEVAEEYLEDLIARNIVMVRRRRSNGRIKTCYLHDLMRDFCLRESRKENFLCVFQNFGNIPKYCTEFLEKELRNLPRLALYTNLHVLMKTTASFPYTRSFFCFEALRPIDIKHFYDIPFRLLKVLDLMHVHSHSLPLGILRLITLKYLAATIQKSINLSEFSKIRSLQTCIIDCEFSGLLPREFWNMTELRHINLKRRSSMSPHSFVFSGWKFSLDTSLQNLQSLSTIGPLCCTKEIFCSMPNLRKLGVYATEEDSLFLGWFNNLAFLTNLERLKYSFSNPFARPGVKPERLPSRDVFPPSLMKLTLSGTSFPWEDIHQLSLLPKLEVLKLRNYAFSGEVWNLGESCFKCLKFVMIGSTNLEKWEADNSHFPRLEHLVLRHCRSLKEIPFGLAEAPLLNKIELHSCRHSAVVSARQFQQEQQDLGNDWLTVYITGNKFQNSEDNI